MKKPILYFVLLLSTNFLFAQGGSITFNPDVPNVTDGIVDFTFDLVGGGAEYDLSVEVSFDNGDNWADIPAGSITGNLNNVVPATGIALQWDALASFPGQVTNDARLRSLPGTFAEQILRLTMLGRRLHTAPSNVADFAGLTATWVHRRCQHLVMTTWVTVTCSSGAVWMTGIR